jgi:hypothetical protein
MVNEVAVFFKKIVVITTKKYLKTISIFSSLGIANILPEKII